MNATRAWWKMAVVAFFLSGCAPWNVATRREPDAGKTVALGDSPSIEGHTPGGATYGCKFIEFDGKGGIINYAQFDDAQKFLTAETKKRPVLLIIYCHGWQNNAQSGDVLRFVTFLKQLADTPELKGHRVEGVFLGWRGSEFLPVMDGSAIANLKKGLEPDFGGDIVDPGWANPIPGTIMALPKVLTYFSIKDRAEYQVSRVPLARTVYQLAYTVKSSEAKHKSQVFLLGHSFGALVLEQAVAQASVGLLASEWAEPSGVDRWPFDLVVLMNSAAPSLYAKQQKELLENDLGAGSRPRIISITSTADHDTGTLHEIGNLGNRYFATDLQRKYYPYVTEGLNAQGREVSKTDWAHSMTAGAYYDYTPGHNPVLLSHWIVSKPCPKMPELSGDPEVFARNLSVNNDPNIFYTYCDGGPKAWALEPIPDEKRREMNHGLDPGPYPSNYWFVSEPGMIIHNHGDIWSEQCMEMLAGIYRIAVLQNGPMGRQRRAIDFPFDMAGKGSRWTPSMR